MNGSLNSTKNNNEVRLCIGEGCNNRNSSSSHSNFRHQEGARRQGHGSTTNKQLAQQEIEQQQRECQERGEAIRLADEAGLQRLKEDLRRWKEKYEAAHPLEISELRLSQARANRRA